MHAANFSARLTSCWNFVAVSGAFQMRAGLVRGLEPGTVEVAAVCLGRVEGSVALGIGEARQAVGTHAPGVGELPLVGRLVRRRSCSGWRAAACRYQHGDARYSESNDSPERQAGEQPSALAAAGTGVRAITPTGWDRATLAHPALTGLPRNDLDALAAALAGPRSEQREQNLHQRRASDRQRAPGAGARPG